MRLIVAAPLVAVVGFAGLALADSVAQAERASDLGVLARLGSDAGELVYQLQRERAAAADLLTTASPTRQDEYARQSTTTDDAVARYRRQRASVPEVAVGIRAVLHRIDADLAGLPALRVQVRTAAHASVSAATFSYRIVVADLLDYRESIAQGVASASVADGIRAAAALAKTAEAVGQQQVAVMRAVASGELTPAMQQDITAARTGFTENSLSFLALARPGWVVWWEQAGSGKEALALQRLQDQVSRTRPGNRLDLETADWIAATQDWTARLFEVQRLVDTSVLADVDAARTDQRRRAIAESSAMAAALLLTVLVTWVVAREITRRLRRLRDAANSVAFKQLPAMVAELGRADSVAVQPEVLARQSAVPIDTIRNDEIGEVAQAFTAVHQAAVRTAAEQAVMRANTADIFIHLSRREQRLVDAVLAQVDRVERDETDPERLEQLYALDSLATRMGRINASLLVLGGVGVGRVRHGDVPMPKILQAALSQIEHYPRVRIGVVDGDVAVAADKVDEVVHLLAELMDNATSYSPPETEAWVTARSLGDRVIVQIGDEGVGLSPQRLAQLNEVLARPPVTDVAAVRAMGLVVVGQLANRLGAVVELRPGPKLGTIAEVALPGTLIRPVPAEARPPAAAAVTAGQPRPATVPIAGNGSRGIGDRVLPGERVRAGGRVPPGGRVPAGERVPPGGRVPAGERVPPGSRVPAGGVPPGDRVLAGERVLAAASVFRPTPPRSGRVDEPTQELVIFQEVNNWFRTDRTDRTDRQNGPGWQSSADDGWRAATELATPEVVATTPTGLPIRQPQRHLVPGGVTPPAHRPPPPAPRDPAEVANAMAAYARGVAARHPKLVNASATRDATGSST